MAGSWFQLLCKTNNIICAGVLLTLIPSLIVFLLFQKQVYAGLASGSVKG